MKKKKVYIRILFYIILIVVAAITLFPVFYAVMQSLRSNMEIMAHPEVIVPENPTLNNYKEILSSDSFNLPLLLKNSILYTGAKVIISLFISTMAGYAFARGNFRGKNIIFVCFSSLLFIKLGGISVYATFDIYNALNFPIALQTLILTAVFGVPVMQIYLVKGYISTLPKELDESAKMDGCSFFGIYYRIILPLMKPMLATLAILAFKNSWNEYVMPTIFTLSRPEQRTLIVALMALKNSSGAAVSWHIMFAGVVVTLIPVMIVYLWLNKYFVSGLTAGAVKG